MLTPSELRNAQFSKARLGGYVMSEVDKLLDEVTPPSGPGRGKPRFFLLGCAPLKKEGLPGQKAPGKMKTKGKFPGKRAGIFPKEECG